MGRIHETAGGHPVSSGMETQDTRWTPPAIRGLRKRLGMTQPEFAQVLGYSHRTGVARLEGGTVPSASVRRVLDYVEAYGPLERETALSEVDCLRP